jgi:hypothetical protein
MISLFLAAPAMALAPNWGVGPHLGTTALPAGSPIAFPPKVGDYDFDGDGLADDADGDGVADGTTLTRARGDLLLGAAGYVWTPSGVLRGGITADLGVAARFVQGSVLLTVDRSYDLDTAYVNVGGGLGFASARWRGTDRDERLRVPSYPLRVQASVLAPISDFIAVEGKLFAQLAVPLRHRYWDVAGVEQGVAGVPFSHLALGVEFGGLYGLFR